MQFSFNKTKKSKAVPLNAFKSLSISRAPQKNEEKKNDTNDDQIGTKENIESDDDNNDPYAIFKDNYKIAIDTAESGKYPESLRAFDLSIRFWVNHMEKLKNRYPARYKLFKFPDVNGCEASKHFLDKYKKKKDVKSNKIKKNLWKPPPKNQPKQPRNIDINVRNGIEDDDEEIIFFDDTDSDLEDPDQDIDLMKDDSDSDEIKEWEKLVLSHRKCGSEMFEYQAQVLMEMDRDFEAIKACQSAILLNDLSEINWLTLSRAELNFGDPFQALLSVSRAIELNFENDEVIEHYSKVYRICNKLSEMKKIGKMTDDVLKRRLVTNTKIGIECKHNVNIIAKRMKNRQAQKDHIGKLHKLTETQQIVSNYRDKLEEKEKSKSNDESHKK